MTASCFDIAPTLKWLLTLGPTHPHSAAKRSMDCSGNQYCHIKRAGVFGCGSGTEARTVRQLYSTSVPTIPKQQIDCELNIYELSLLTCWLLPRLPLTLAAFGPFCFVFFFFFAFSLSGGNRPLTLLGEAVIHWRVSKWCSSPSLAERGSAWLLWCDSYHNGQSIKAVHRTAFHEAICNCYLPTCQKTRMGYKRQRERPVIVSIAIQRAALPPSYKNQCPFYLTLGSPQHQTAK